MTKHLPKPNLGLQHFLGIVAERLLRSGDLATVAALAVLRTALRYGSQDRQMPPRQAAFSTRQLPKVP